MRAPLQPKQLPHRALHESAGFLICYMYKDVHTSLVSHSCTRLFRRLSLAVVSTCFSHRCLSEDVAQAQEMYPLDSVSESQKKDSFGTSHASSVVWSHPLSQFPDEVRHCFKPLREKLSHIHISLEFGYLVIFRFLQFSITHVMERGHRP